MFPLSETALADQSSSALVGFLIMMLLFWVMILITGIVEFFIQRYNRRHKM